MDLTTWARTQWDRLGAMVAAFLGAVVLLVGYLGVSGEGVVAKQLPFIISGGIGGIFLLGIAAVLWLSADLRDEWRVLEEIRVALTPSGTPVEPVGSPAAPEPTHVETVAAPRPRRRPAARTSVTPSR